MSQLEINRLLGVLASQPGVQGCALVDPDTGMVWYHAGELPDIERTGEAAVEFWRVQSRLSSHFAKLGALRSAACAFVNGTIALFPCLPSPLVLVCIASKQEIDWAQWGESALALKKVLASEVVSGP
ncbi:MAG: hypothetical protein O9327_12525 [Polaromonas sp.]|nr:hypothetical protein [Polaromonas sp.]